MTHGSGGNENGKFAGVRALIFDLDGTLVDSKLDLALAVDATLKHMGRASLPHETIAGHVGRGANALIRSVLGENVTNEEVETGLAYFLSYYRAHMLDNTLTYPGVREALASLAKYPMAVLTNKPVRFSKAILEGLGLLPFFKYVYGGNSFETKKPDPAGINVLLRDLGMTAGAAMVVGDSDVDVRTARNAGAWACGVTYGFGSASLRDNPPDLMVDNLVELPGHLRNSDGTV